MQILHNIIRLCVVTSGLVLAAGGALAVGKSVALIEESTAASVQEFDLFKEGDSFNLSAGETVVIGYMTSCTRETITGGSVTIGAKESDVAGGKVAREEVQCTEPRLELTAAESQEGAVIAFRPAGAKKHTFTCTPLLMRSDKQTLFVEIVEAETGTVVASLQSDAANIDLAAEKIELQPGRMYHIKRSGYNMIMLEIDKTAKPGGSTLERAVLLD